MIASERRVKAVAVLELIMAIGITVFWALFSFTDMMAIADPELERIYHAFESSFPVADGYLVALLGIGGIGLLLGRSWGFLASLAGGGALIFLGLLDMSFNSQQGIYALSTGDLLFNGFINVACIVVGALVLILIWRNRNAHLPEKES